jgi:hypothetical protein
VLFGRVLSDILRQLHLFRTGDSRRSSTARSGTWQCFAAFVINGLAAQGLLAVSDWFWCCGAVVADRVQPCWQRYCIVRFARAAAVLLGTKNGDDGGHIFGESTRQLAWFAYNIPAYAENTCTFPCSRLYALVQN